MIPDNKSKITIIYILSSWLTRKPLAPYSVVYNRLNILVKFLGLKETFKKKNYFYDFSYSKDNMAHPTLGRLKNTLPQPQWKEKKKRSILTDLERRTNISLQ